MSKNFGEKDLTGFDEAKALLAVIASKGFRPVESITMEYRWDAPDGGSLNLNLQSASIGWVNVDVHAHWRFVLELFQHLRSVYRDLVIVDPQTGTMYDAESFDALIDAKYAEETDRIREVVEDLVRKPKA